MGNGMIFYYSPYGVKVKGKRLSLLDRVRRWAKKRDRERELLPWQK